MSASDKKKLRKEQTAAAITEKQRTEQKQQKKLKIYSLTFIITMVLVVALVLVAVLQTPVKNLVMRNTTAVTVGDHKLSAAEFNYFYYDTIYQFYSTFDDYGDYQDLYFQIYYGFNPAKPLNEQFTDQEAGTTWADFFIESGIESAKWTYAMYDKAMADNYTLSEEDQASLDSISTYLYLYAAYGGYSSTDAYLKNQYGSAADTESYLAYYELSTIATSYASDYVDGLEFEDQDYRDHEADKFHEYSSFSYATITLPMSNYLTGGETVTSEDGSTSIVYSDEEKDAARAAALAAAESLVSGTYANAEELNMALALLYTNDDSELTKSTATSTEITSKLYSSLSISNEDMKDWLIDTERTTGDISYFRNVTTTDDVESVYSYTVVLFLDRNDNTMSVGTVRHLLVKFEGGTTDETTNETVYSDEEKAAALEEAEKLLKQFQEGEEVDEEAFIVLVKAYSDDTGTKTTGGLISDITPDSGYVSSFTNWAIADHEEGDVEIIESEYGYHIMYYVEANELNYRDLLINAELVEEAYTEWEESVLESVTAAEVDMKHIKRDYVISK